eukprot:TRINITY_DN15799_c0_g1_i1.p1 TRINITY_DN15799_c0_g1~~TRINITY_DN15799_c0_g1_i1.p1  ORF type:complete len:220 (-),score=37.94 TRINITY_DN15799_c0_g1_i1:230-889(-)
MFILRTIKRTATVGITGLVGYTAYLNYFADIDREDVPQGSFPSHHLCNPKNLGTSDKFCDLYSVKVPFESVSKCRDEDVQTTSTRWTKSMWGSPVFRLEEKVLGNKPNDVDLTTSDFNPGDNFVSDFKVIKKDADQTLVQVTLPEANPIGKTFYHGTVVERDDKNQCFKLYLSSIADVNNSFDEQDLKNQLLIRGHQWYSLVLMDFARRKFIADSQTRS